MTGTGHSAGGATWGATLRTQDVTVDAVALVAAPGAFAGSVDDYRTRTDVHVVTSRTDAIGAVSSGVPTTLLGPDPTSPRFGADVIDLADASWSVWHPYGGYVSDPATLDALAEILRGERAP